ncbi:MAG: hypothetical protein IAE65_03225 [Ignavibacteria bacterium]|nr:hypothetical protein [Ignavibacteria bacterium]
MNNLIKIILNLLLFNVLIFYSLNNTTYSKELTNNYNKDSCRKSLKLIEVQYYCDSVFLKQIQITPISASFDINFGINKYGNVKLDLTNNENVFICRILDENLLSGKYSINLSPIFMSSDMKSNYYKIYMRYTENNDSDNIFLDSTKTLLIK